MNADGVEHIRVAHAHREGDSESLHHLRGILAQHVESKHSIVLSVVKDFHKTRVTRLDGFVVETIFHRCKLSGGGFVGDGFFIQLLLRFADAGKGR